MTDAEHGVDFPLAGPADVARISWSAPGSSNGWLVLDRNSNGRIDDATEMFGTLTPQPPGANPNGYRALAVFDAPENGGNGNGEIDPGDAVFSRLRVWIDRDHDGISQPDELFTLPEAGIFAISLSYSADPGADPHGNRFALRSSVVKSTGARAACFDIFLTVLPGARR